MKIIFPPTKGSSLTAYYMRAIAFGVVIGIFVGGGLKGLLLSVLLNAAFNGFANKESDVAYFKRRYGVKDKDIFK